MRDLVSCAGGQLAKRPWWSLSRPFDSFHDNPNPTGELGIRGHDRFLVGCPKCMENISATLALEPVLYSHPTFLECFSWDLMEISSRISHRHSTWSFAASLSKPGGNSVPQTPEGPPAKVRAAVSPVVGSGFWACTQFCCGASFRSCRCIGWVCNVMASANLSTGHWNYSSVRIYSCWVWWRGLYD